MSFLDLIKYKLFPPKNIHEIAKVLTEKIAADSFSLFNKQQFRKLVNFDKLDQQEQDRIFNEILVAGLILLILMFSRLEKMAPHDIIRQFYAELQMEMHSRYSNWLKELGTSSEFTDLWKTLIKMRTEEYRRDYKEHRRELEKDWQKNPWVFVTALGGYKHIRRGQGKPGDPLFKIFLRWNIKIANETAVFIRKTLKA